MTAGRYVGMACPLCDERSPTCDQREDPVRVALLHWWQDHRIKHMPLPVLEVRTEHNGGTPS